MSGEKLSVFTLKLEFKGLPNRGVQFKMNHHHKSTVKPNPHHRECPVLNSTFFGKIVYQSF